VSGGKRLGIHRKRRGRVDSAARRRQEFLSQGHFTKEGDMRRFNWNAIIQALVLIRLGQELGSESQIAKAVHDIVAAVLVICR
jgi:hypothetical protein